MIKTYIVYPKNKPDFWFEVDAPTKRVAKWCGLNVIQASYCCAYTVKDLVAKRSDK